ncbi:MAG: alkaline phosphatase family protein, partial [Acidobacteriaceae bacterium]
MGGTAAAQDRAIPKCKRPETNRIQGAEGAVLAFIGVYAMGHILVLFQERMLASARLMFVAGRKISKSMRILTMKEQAYRCGRLIGVCASLVLAAGMFMGLAPRAEAAGKGQAASAPKDIPIKHIIIIFQENRSFDSYFGTFPGADGIPMRNGVPTVCNPDPTTGKCVKPYLDHNDVNCGGPHAAEHSLAVVDNGKMDGFIRAVQAEAGFGLYPLVWASDYCKQPTDPKESDPVMGYHNGGDIPNYWAYAKHFVLQDHMFETLHSWSFPSHLYLVSAWSATCGQSANPMSCVTALMPEDRTLKNPTPF